MAFMKNVKHEYLEGKTILLISLPNYSNGIIKEMKKLGENIHLRKQYNI